MEWNLGLVCFEVLENALGVGDLHQKTVRPHPCHSDVALCSGCAHQKFQERGQFAVSQLGLSAGGRRHHVISLLFLSLLQGKWKTMTMPAPDPF